MRYILNLYVIQDHIVDMLQEHRKRNRPVHPPNMQKLGHATTIQHRVQQAVSFNDNNDNGEVANRSDKEEDSEEESSPIRERERRHSKVLDGAAPKPTTMKYYSKSWQSVLLIAKNNFRRYVALVHAFPDREKHLKEATHILRDTIAKYTEEGNELDDGKSPSCILSNFLRITDNLYLRSSSGSSNEYSCTLSEALHLRIISVMPEFFISDIQ
jgi:hypothetical protein